MLRIIGDKKVSINLCFYNTKKERYRMRGRPAKKINTYKIYELLDRGHTLREIGKQLGVCYTTISRRLKREKSANKQEVIVKRGKRSTTYIVLNECLKVVRN